MKKFTYLFLCLTFLAAPVFTSCEDEPVEGDFATNPDGTTTGTNTEQCDLAQQALTVAEAVYVAATDTNYTEACNAYKVVLDGVIQICGDPGNVLETIFGRLGDCSTVNLCLQAEMRSVIARTAFEAATDTDREALCLSYITALENQIAACGDANGQLQNTINGLDCVDDCVEATTARETAETAFNAVDVTDGDAYTAACNAYKTALQVQLAACGDATGTIQIAIDALGDCAPPEQNGPVRMFIDGTFKNFNSLSVSSTGSTLNVLATDVDAGDTFFFRLVLTQTGLNVLQDVLLIIDGTEYTTVDNIGTDFDSAMFVNAPGDAFKGVFNGLVRDMAGNELTLTNGIIDNVAKLAVRYPDAMSGAQALVAFNDAVVSGTATAITFTSGTGTNGEMLSFSVLPMMTGADLLQSFVMQIGGVSYTPVATPGSFNSYITTNDGVEFEGFFSGLIENATGDQIEINQAGFTLLF